MRVSEIFLVPVFVVICAACSLKNSIRSGGSKQVSDCETCLDFAGMDKAFHLENIQNSRSEIEIRAYSVTMKRIAVSVIKYENKKFLAYVFTKKRIFITNNGVPPDPSFNSYTIEDKNLDSIVRVLEGHQIFAIPDPSDIESDYKGKTKTARISSSIQTKKLGKIHEYGIGIDIADLAKENPEVKELQDHLAILRAFSDLTSLIDESGFYR